MTINNPREFKVCRDVNDHDGTTSRRWVPMGKSISNLYRYAEISKPANKRFLDSMCNVIPVQSIEKEIDSICTGNHDTSQERERMSRMLAKIRVHGLMRKIPHSRRDLVTNKGRRVLGH